MILQHPYTTPTLVLTLPNPDLNDVENIDYGVSFNRTMTAAVLSYVKDKKVKLVLSFKLITLALIAEIQNFIAIAWGDDVKMTDWRSRVWNIRIVSGPIEFRAYGDDKYTFTLEVEGTLV